MPEAPSTTPHSEGGPSDEARLLRAAAEVRERAWAPYSGFQVGAALETADGTVFAGCNVENSSLGLTLCAERSAAVQAVSAGRRDFARIAIVTGSEDPVQPCGACRQFLAEFGLDLEVVTQGASGAIARSTLRELLPGAFRLGEERP